jgi:hypothetical protein
MTTYLGKGDEYYAMGSITALKPVFGLGWLGGYYIPMSTLVFMRGVVTPTEFEIQPAQN